jgi:hypothetical protein
VSTHDSAPGGDRQIDEVTAELDRSLRRMRLSRDDRRTVVGDVRADLETAAADGVSPVALIGPDIDAFARKTVDAGGYLPRRRDFSRVIAGGVLATVVVVVAAYLLIVEVLQPLFASWFTLDGHYPTAGPVVVYAAITLGGLLGTLAGLRWLLTDRPAARPTVTRAALLLPIGAAAGIAAVVALARTPNYRSTPGTVTLQVLFVLIGVATALAVARWWAVRTSNDRNDAVGASQPLRH